MNHQLNFAIKPEYRKNVHRQRISNQNKTPTSFKFTYNNIAVNTLLSKKLTKKTAKEVRSLNPSLRKQTLSGTRQCLI